MYFAILEKEREREREREFLCAIAERNCLAGMAKFPGYERAVE